MHHLSLSCVGPIKQCEIDIDDFTVFTGAQATGKSTIAKSIFFFRTIKNDILESMLKRSGLNDMEISLNRTVTRLIRNKFLQIFGTSRALSNQLRMLYNYNKDTFVEITLRLNTGDDYVSPNYVYFDFSRNIEQFLRDNNDKDISEREERDRIHDELNRMFSDDCETIFIPAGRSLITLLTTQLNYIFTVMDEEQKRLLDFCTQKYIERILRIRPSFDGGIRGYFDNKRTTSITSFDTAFARKCMALIDEILKGRYLYVSGEERLVLDNNKYVKINYTSSGQQESVWIFNILMYQLINNIKTFIILEEPEAHLYPDAQKKMVELLSMFQSKNNELLLTTHSPYVLGTINNLIYAKQIECQTNSPQTDAVVEKEKRIERCSAYNVHNGHIYGCLAEDRLIKNEVIDGASEEINQEYDRLFEIVNGEI